MTPCWGGGRRRDRLAAHSSNSSWPQVGSSADHDARSLRANIEQRSEERSHPDPHFPLLSHIFLSSTRTRTPLSLSLSLCLFLTVQSNSVNRMHTALRLPRAAPVRLFKISAHFQPQARNTNPSRTMATTSSDSSKKTSALSASKLFDLTGWTALVSLAGLLCLTLTDGVSRGTIARWVGG